MKIEYRPAATAGGYTTLMDVTNGDTIEPWEPVYSAKPQVEELAQNKAQGSSIFTAVLGNIRCNLPLHNMNVKYATLSDALAASRTVPTAFLNLLMVLKVTEGAETQYFPNCVCSSVRANVQGCNVTYTMELVTQMVVGVEPA